MGKAPSHFKQVSVLFDGGKEKVIDFGAIWSIYYDKYRIEEAISKHQKVLVHDSFLWPVENIEVDWEAVTSYAQHQANITMQDVGLRLLTGLYTEEDLRSELKAALGRLEISRARYADLLKKQANINAESLSSNVTFWEVSTVTAEMLRDASIVILSAGGAILTGGASTVGAGLAATAGSSVLGSIAARQDSKVNISAKQAFQEVAINSTLDFTFSLCSFGADKYLNFAKTTKILIVITINSTNKSLTSLVSAGIQPTSSADNKEILDLVGAATFDSVLSEGLSAFLKTNMANGALRKLTVPLASVMKNNKADAAMGEFVPKVSKSLVKKVIKKPVKNTIEMGSQSMLSSDGGMIDRTPLPNAIRHAPILGGAAINAARLRSVFVD